MGKRFRASMALLVSAFMIFAFVVPAIAQEDLPDLTAKDFEASLTEEGYIKITWKLINLGGFSVPYEGYIIFYVHFYISADAFITSSDILLYSKQIKMYRDYRGKAGFVEGYPEPVLGVPEGIIPGSYYVGVIVDATNMVNESNEGNNTACAPVTILPDLSVRNLESAGGERDIWVTGQVVNKYLRTYDPFYLDFYLSEDTTITSSDIFIGRERIQMTVDDYGNRRFYPPVYMALPYDGGSYYVGVIVDATGKINELDEGNNTACSPEPIEIATVTAAELAKAAYKRGEVEVERKGELISLIEGLVLEIGDRITTKEDSFTKIVYLDGVISLRQATSIILQETAIEFLSGLIHAKITGTPTKKFLKEFTTPWFSYTFRFTEFILEVAEDGTTTLTVLEGTVGCIDRFTSLAWTQPVYVEQYQTLVVTPGETPSNPVPIDPSKIDRWWEGWGEEGEQPPPDQLQPPSVFTCPICHENFSKHMQMLAHHYPAHFETYEPSKARCFCFICGAEFSTLSGAATHIITHAETERPMYCPFCRTRVHEVDPHPLAMYEHWTQVHDWWPTAYGPPEGWWPGGMKPPSDWTPPETWEVPDNLRRDVIPPWMPEESWKRPENWTPRSDWVPSERWMPTSDQLPSEWMPEDIWAEPPSGFERPETITPTSVPQWIDTKEENYHWIPPENKPFWTWHRDDVTTDAPVGFNIPENSTPFIRPSGDAPWTTAERIAENVSVGGIKMNVRENVSDVVMTILPLKPEDLPEGVPPPEEDFCEFFQVGTNIPALIENAEIGIKVDQDWIAANNLDKHTITVERYPPMGMAMKVPEEWKDLPTTIRGEDENYLYLSAQVPSFSVFAVTGKAKGEAIVPAPEAFPSYLVSVGVGVAIVLIAFALYRKRRV